MSRGKAKKQKNPQATSGPKNTRGAHLYVTEISRPPLNLSKEELLIQAELFVEKAKGEFAASFARVRTAILKHEPLSLLSYLSSLYLFGEGGLERESLDGRSILQFHVELLQALVLQHNQDAFPWLPTAPNIAELLSDLDIVGKTFLLHRMKLKESESDQTLLQVQGHMRGHTQAVRNWGYPDQIERTTVELFTAFAHRVEACIGVKPTSLFGLFRKVMTTIELRRNANFDFLAPVMKAKTPRDAIRAYDRLTANRSAAPGDLEEVWNRLFPGLDLQQTKWLLLNHWSLLLVETFAFSIDDLLTLYGEAVDQGAFVAAMEQMSLSFGALINGNPEHFFLDNPVWLKPFIRLEDGRFFIPVPGMLLSFGLEILENLIMNHPTLRTPYTEHRASFLETTTADLFRRALPDAQVFVGNMWPRKGLNEIDVLVIIDRVAVIVETKAGSVTAARIGNVDRLKTGIKSTMIKGSKQTGDFAAYLRDNPGQHHFDTRWNTVNSVDTSHVKEFIRLNVMLHQLGNIYNRWPQLREAGLISPDADMTPTMTLADLETVFEVLDGECPKLHYLARRAELERHTNYSGGELDLLALYLETGFNIGSLEFEPSELVLNGKFKKLERYFMRHETKQIVRKTPMTLSKWWRTMLRHVESVKPLGWSRLGMALLTFPYEDQERIERRFTGTKRVVRKFWKNEGHVDLVYLDTGPAQRRLAVAAFAHRNDLASRREAKIREVIGQVFDGVSANKLLFIGSNVELDKNPWDDLIVAFRPTESSNDDETKAD